MCFFPCYFFKLVKNYHKKEVNVPLKHLGVTSIFKVILIMNSPHRELLENYAENVM